MSENIAQPVLIYVADPLCGWCYGFGSELAKLRSALKTSLHIVYLPGGMSVGERARPIAETSQYIRQALEVVTEKTGAIFGAAFKDGVLATGTYVYDSLPPCMAMHLIVNFYPHVDWLAYNQDLQAALFVDGKDLNEFSTYTELCKKHGLDPVQFQAQMDDELTRAATQNDFKRAAQFGVRAFPALLLLDGDSITPIQNGYGTAGRILMNVERLMAKRLSLD